MVQTDAYEVYPSLFARNRDIQHYYCMAHIAGPPLTESQIVEKRMAEASPILSQLKDYPDIEELRRSCRGRGSK